MEGGVSEWNAETACGMRRQCVECVDSTWKME